MKVFKFGGASVNSADAVRNMAQVVQSHLESKPLMVVVSAMGKTTNLLEKLVPGSADVSSANTLRQQLEVYHLDIAKSLIPNDKTIIKKIQDLLHQLDNTIVSLQPDAAHYNYNYDQVVSFGEIISTTIIAEYLNHLGINTLWSDARQLIQTDNHYREGRVDWQASETATKTLLADSITHSVILTQGFIGAANPKGVIRFKLV